jgi:hypothetical protein
MAMKLCHQPSTVVYDKASTIDRNWWFCAIFAVFCFMVCFLQVMKSGCFCCDDNWHLVFFFLLFFIDGEVMVFLSWIWRILMMDFGSIVDIVGSALVKGGISFRCGFWC